VFAITGTLTDNGTWDTFSVTYVTSSGSFANSDVVKISFQRTGDKGGSLTWYTPKIIATEQSRENTEYGFLATEDKIEGIVVPENGLVLVTYRAHVKSSVASAGRAAIFFGATQAKKVDEGGSELTFSDTTFDTGYTDPSNATGWSSGGGAGAVTTGQIAGGASQHYLAAGTYTVGIKYKSTSGSVTAKERQLRVVVIGT
jgi:hypothetical protein